MIEFYKYTDKELQELIDSMVIIIDTREKCNDHLLKMFDKMCVKYTTRALKYGDYSFYIPENNKLGINKPLFFDKQIIVERKGSLEEISGNLTEHRDRFEKELALAPKNKVIIIESSNYADIINGNYRTKYNQKSFWASYHSFWHKYNCPIVFMPDKYMSAYFIRGYFVYYLKNKLR